MSTRRQRVNLVVRDHLNQAFPPISLDHYAFIESNLRRPVEERPRLSCYELQASNDYIVSRAIPWSLQSTTSCNWNVQWQAWVDEVFRLFCHVYISDALADSLLDVTRISICDFRSFYYQLVTAAQQDLPYQDHLLQYTQLPEERVTFSATRNHMDLNHDKALARVLIQAYMRTISVANRSFENLWLNRISEHGGFHYYRTLIRAGWMLGYTPAVPIPQPEPTPEPELAQGQGGGDAAGATMEMAPAPDIPTQWSPNPEDDDEPEDDDDDDEPEDDEDDDEDWDT
jgi:hypothetical protein